jgi:hypothetical protein
VWLIFFKPCFCRPRQIPGLLTILHFAYDWTVCAYTFDFDTGWNPGIYQFLPFFPPGDTKQGFNFKRYISVLSWRYELSGPEQVHDRDGAHS